MADSSELNAYAELAGAWRSLERTHGLKVDEVLSDGHTQLLKIDLHSARAERVVALCSGVHGDEPAAPWALFSVVRDGLLDDAFAYRVWCCTNPTGYAHGTRVNAAGADINRSFSRDGRSATTPEARAIERTNGDRRFALSLDLHEDFEAEGFYCYEPVVDGSSPFGRHVIAAIDEAGLPVQVLPADFDLGYPVEATHLRAIERGRVLPDVAAEVRHFEGLPYSMYLLWTATAKRTMTLESPRSLPWETRLSMHRTAVVAALGAARAFGASA